ncbi:MAG: hypothetical protein FWD73_16900 [Polyangiaceae bacterium]|nr:hypothetical protein [Polyangiaceae bacterium]
MADADRSLTGVFHASLTPNFADAGGTLEVMFDSTGPWKTADNVTLRIVEVDVGIMSPYTKKKAPPGEDTRDLFEPEGKDKCLVTFKGSLSNNKFTSTSTKVLDVKKNPPKIYIKIDDKTTEVPLPDKAEERGVFELRLEVDIPDPTTNKPKSKPKTFKSPTAVFVRLYEHFKVHGVKRPVASFITGLDQNPNTRQHSYFTAATKFWKLNSDATVSKKGISLQEIVKTLNKQSAKYGMWGQINIVAHGREDAIFIKLFEKSEDNYFDIYSFMKQREQEEKWDEEKKSKYRIPAPVGIDSDTQIVFRACNAGRSQELVDHIHQEVFGGKGTLYIPKFIQFYDCHSDAFSPLVATEYFMESLVFYRPTKPQDTPKDQALTRGLQEAWDALVSPGKGGDFDEEIKTFKEKNDRQEPGFKSSYDGDIKGWTNDRLLEEFKSKWDEIKSWITSGTSPEEWHIVVLSRTDKSAVFNCTRYRVDRRRKLRTYDAAKKYADRTLMIPRIDNPDHYGSSSQQETP